jgi:hypothetical protein
MPVEARYCSGVDTVRGIRDQDQGWYGSSIE